MMKRYLLGFGKTEIISFLQNTMKKANKDMNDKTAKTRACAKDF